MIAVDANLLVYAHRRDSPWHEKALAVLQRLAEGDERWAIPWPCAHEFLAIVTHPRIFRPPTSLTVALEAISAWLASPTVSVLAEDEEYFGTLSEVCRSAHVEGALVHDARIVAVCRRHGVRELWSADRDFSRFSGVRIVNPLVAGKGAK